MKMTIEQIALDIADESETSAIETACLVTILEGVTWYDTASRPDLEPAPLQRAVAYLEERRLLIRHPARPELVRVPFAAELGRASLDLFAQ